MARIVIGGAIVPVREAKIGQLIKGTMAQPVYGYEVVPVGKVLRGGSAMPVKILKLSDLRVNGGRYEVMGGEALKICVFPTARRSAGPAIAVYPVNNNWLFGPEKALNGGFETAGGGGGDIWANWVEYKEVGGVIADETVDVHSGGHAAKITTGANRAENISSDPFVVIPGTTQRLICWGHGDGTGSPNYWVQDVTHGARIVADTSMGIPGTVYGQVTKTFVVPAGCTSVLVGFYPRYAVGGIAYFDDVSVKQIITRQLVQDILHPAWLRGSS